MRKPPLAFTGPGIWHDTKRINILKAYLVSDATNAEAKITDGQDQLFAHLKCSSTTLGTITFEEPAELTGMKISVLTGGTLYIYHETF